MIIAKGVSYPSSMQDELIGRMEAELNETLAQKTLPAETVIAAIDRLGRQVAAGTFDSLIDALPMSGAAEYKDLAIKLLSRDYLEFKLRTELGAEFCSDAVTSPPAGLEPVGVRTLPLGVLLHIAAGNVDGLPAFSLAEGLLTGNINILKLPQADGGLSTAVIGALIDIEPVLADFIYVFDTPSSDVAAIQKLAGLSDGIVVWGGDAAVTAVRRFALPGTKLIEWGHKLSFAYLSHPESIPDAALERLAGHIAETKQLLCSSCQTIYLDTGSMEDVRTFCARFLPILDAAMDRRRDRSLGGMAETTLQRHTDRLERILEGGLAPGVFRTALCELTPCEDSDLELSAFSGQVPVKRLPRQDLLGVLRKKKQYLQTAGLLCPPADREALGGLLLRSGVVRITDPGDMSKSFPGESHDGEYPLRRYLRACTLSLPGGEDNEI